MCESPYIQVLRDGEGPIHSMKWRTDLLAWANDAGVKVHDMKTDKGIAFIERPKGIPRPEFLLPQLVWQVIHIYLCEHYTFLYQVWLIWNNSIWSTLKICTVRDHFFFSFQQIVSRIQRILQKRNIISFWQTYTKRIYGAAGKSFLYIESFRIDFFSSNLV